MFKKRVTVAVAINIKGYFVLIVEVGVAQRALSVRLAVREGAKRSEGGVPGSLFNSHRLAPVEPQVW